MFPLPLLLQPRASAIARGLLWGAHLAALVALLLASLPAVAYLAGALALAASLALYLRRPPPPRLRCLADGRLEIRRAASWQAVTVLPESVVLPWFIVLHWRENERRRGLLLPADALPAPAHRRLRVWLRWKSGTGDTALR